MALRDLMFNIKSRFDSTGADDAEKAIEDIGDAADNQGGKLDEFAGKLGAALGAETIRQVIATGIDAATEIQKIGDATGIATPKVNAYLQAYTQSGFDGQAFADDLIALRVALNDANDPTSTAAKAFGDLGLSVAALQQVDSADALGQVATASERMSAVDPTTTTAALAALLGEGATRDFQAAAENIGLAADNVDRLFSPRSDQIEGAADLGDKLRTAGAFLKDQALVVADGANTLIEDVDALATTVFGKIGDFFGSDEKPDVVTAIEDIPVAVKEAFDNTQLTIDEWEAAFATNATAVNEYAVGVARELGLVNTAWQAHADAVQAQLKRAFEFIAGYRRQVRGEADAIAAIIAEINELQGPIRDFGTTDNSRFFPGQHGPPAPNAVTPTSADVELPERIG